MKDYRKLYENIPGACASCAHVRTRIKGKDIQDNETVDYDGGKYAICGRLGGSGASVVMKDVPDTDLPVNECWEWGA